MHGPVEDPYPGGLKHATPSPGLGSYLRRSASVWLSTTGMSYGDVMRSRLRHHRLPIFFSIGAFRPPSIGLQNLGAARLMARLNRDRQSGLPMPSRDDFITGGIPQAKGEASSTFPTLSNHQVKFEVLLMLWPMVVLLVVANSPLSFCHLVTPIWRWLRCRPRHPSWRTNLRSPLIASVQSSVGCDR
ncbi:hypothetical protein VNO77_08044 [Canavalia gladiata]|uniref:Uncharacterized protein n=1 Tax=Canavalia gladiata TaxID=3824 RepID=A0AAN9M8X7_CANGL